MAGGLLQLVAYGAQDIYLTGDPEMTYFRAVYKRHTNFAMECIEQTFQGTPDFGRTSTVVVSRNGDMIHRAFLKTVLPALQTSASTCEVGWIREVGHFLIKNVEVQIGGQMIDKHYSEWLSIWQALTLPASQEFGYSRMIGEDLYVSTLVQVGNTGTTGAASAGNAGYTVASGTTTAVTLYIPLQFWFNRNPGLALPLIALQFHEVKFKFEFRALRELYLGPTVSNSPVLGTTSLWIDYIFLDTDERRRVAKGSHEYLIEQLQFNGDEAYTSTTSVRPKLNFNHPCKSLIFVVQDADNISTANRDLGVDDGTPTYDLRNWSNSTTLLNGTTPVSTALLRLNGHDRFAVQDGAYFDLVQNLNHWPRVPGGSGVGGAYTTSRGIHTYNFALYPAKHQPSGTLNWSRIDNAELQVTLSGAADTGVMKIFVINYNVLRITSGMGGLAYAN